MPANRAITLVSRFCALASERGSGSRDVRAVSQVETSPRWRALDWQVAGALTLFAAALNLVQLLAGPTQFLLRHCREEHDDELEQLVFASRLIPAAFRQRG